MMKTLSYNISEDLVLHTYNYLPEHISSQVTHDEVLYVLEEEHRFYETSSFQQAAGSSLYKLCSFIRRELELAGIRMERGTIRAIVLAEETYYREIGLSF